MKNKHRRGQVGCGYLVVRHVYWVHRVHCTGPWTTARCSKFFLIQSQKRTRQGLTSYSHCQSSPRLLPLGQPRNLRSTHVWVVPAPHKNSSRRGPRKEKCFNRGPTDSVVLLYGSVTDGLGACGERWLDSGMHAPRTPECVLPGLRNGYSWDSGMSAPQTPECVLPGRRNACSNPSPVVFVFAFDVVWLILGSMHLVPVPWCGR